MSQVKLIVSMAFAAAATGLTATALGATITDAEGNTQSTSVDASTFPAPATDGTFSVEVDFSGVASGAFTGAVTALDTNGEQVNPGVSYSGTATNLEPLPVSVNVAFS